MSSFGDGGTDYSALSNVDSGASSLGDGNSFGFTTGLGNSDTGGGLDTLNAGLMGPGAGTVNNGYLDGMSNYTPDGTTDGISAGSLNGDTSFAMPSGSGLNGGSMAQLAGQALGMGSKLAQAQGSQQRGSGGGGKLRVPQVTFGNPIVDFAGSNGGSQAGTSLLQLLAKYAPGMAK